MANPMRTAFLIEVTRRFGVPRKLPNSESLYEVGDGQARLYFRYSKKHPRNRMFFGLRKIDLQALEGYAGILCFCWDGQREPLFVPFADFEEVFAGVTPASDGQYKAMVFETEGGTELYIASAGRFNVESYLGWSYLDSMVSTSKAPLPSLSHVQVQTLIGAIGSAKGFDVWIPPTDRASLDWSLSPSFSCSKALPSVLEPVARIAEEIDVIWLDRGGNRPTALYEVEHSTPIYSGLLRFNDVHLTLPNLPLRYGIISNDDRRALFVRQLSRPTFTASGLRDRCTFLEYRNVYGWYQRLQRGEYESSQDST